MVLVRNVGGIGEREGGFAIESVLITDPASPSPALRMFFTSFGRITKARSHRRKITANLDDIAGLELHHVQDQFDGGGPIKQRTIFFPSLYQWQSHQSPSSDFQITRRSGMTSFVSETK